MYRSFKQSVILYQNGKLWHLRPWTRHSLVLLVAGTAYVIIGIAYITTEPTPTRTVALQYALNWFSITAWGCWFIITGIVTMISARWPPVDRVWGYEMLTGLASAWSMFYLAGIVFGNSPWTNITGAIVWGVFGFLWWAISGLLDPEPGHGQV